MARQSCFEINWPLDGAGNFNSIPMFSYQSKGILSQMSTECIGQIKPKAVWVRRRFSQKINEWICFVCCELQKSKQNKFVRVLGESTAHQSDFRIIWPLGRWSIMGTSFVNAPLTRSPRPFSSLNYPFLLLFSGYVLTKQVSNICWGQRKRIGLLSRPKMVNLKAFGSFKPKTSYFYKARS